MMNEKNIENRLVTLIEDEDFIGAGNKSGGGAATVSVVTKITQLIGITSACTRDCWHPGR